MRNILLYTLLTIISISNLAAAQSVQARFIPTLSVGAKAGATVSRIQFNPTVPQVYRPSATLGVNVRYCEESHFGLIGELNLTTLGFHENFDQTTYSYATSLHYIQMPILTHIYFGTNRVRGFFNLGPQIGYLISSTTKSNFDPANLSTLTDFPTNRPTAQYTQKVKNNFDYGLTLGIGGEVSINKKQALNMEVRFYYGLNDVYSNHKSDPFSASPNLSIGATLGYQFQLK